MNEEQNVNTSPKPKKKRSWWWLKLLLVLVLLAAGVIAGIMLSSQTVTQQILGEFFPQYAQQPPVVVTVSPSEIEAELPAMEYKATSTPAPTPTKAPLEIVSPEAAEAEAAEAAPESSAEPETGVQPSVEESPVPSVLPAFEPFVTDAPAAVEPTPTPAGGYIGIDAALEAALKHAGVDAEKAIVYSVSRERDDGIVYYEVEFAHNSQEYEYEINAYTGVVEGWKTVRAKSNSSAAASTGAAANEGSTQTSYVAIEDAKSTALFHAGYEEHETQGLKASLEIENNKVVYDIEFWAEGYDYDYKVDAESGLVIRVEKERD